MGGGGDDLLEGDGGGELSFLVAGGGDLPSVHGEGLGGFLHAWLGQGGGGCGDVSVVDCRSLILVDFAGEGLRFSDGGECSFHVGPDCLGVSLTGDVDVDGAAFDGPGHRDDELA